MKVMCDNCGTINPTTFSEKGYWLPGAVSEPVVEVLGPSGWTRKDAEDFCPDCSE